MYKSFCEHCAPDLLVWPSTRNHGGGIYVTGCCCHLSAGSIRETTGAVAILPSVSVSTQNGGNGSGSALRSAEGVYFWQKLCQSMLKTGRNFCTQSCALSNTHCIFCKWKKKNKELLVYFFLNLASPITYLLLSLFRCWNTDLGQ